jgi:hypothetical protein
VRFISEREINLTSIYVKPYVEEDDTESPPQESTFNYATGRHAAQYHAGETYDDDDGYDPNISIFHGSAKPQSKRRSAAASSSSLLSSSASKSSRLKLRSRTRRATINNNELNDDDDEENDIAEYDLSNNVYAQEMYSTSSNAPIRMKLARINPSSSLLITKEQHREGDDLEYAEDALAHFNSTMLDSDDGESVPYEYSSNPTDYTTDPQATEDILTSFK